MPRRVLSILLVALAALAACQDYNFNPVGKCVIQPGAQRAEVENIGTADVLFVVDDSGSMRPEQERLKANFSTFIDTLADVQKERALNNLDPFEFHIAVTTSSVFEAWTTLSTVPCGGSPLQCVIPQSSTWYQVKQDVATCTQANAACNDISDYYAFPSGAIPTCPFPGVATGLGPYPVGDFVALGANPRVLHFTEDLEWASWPDPAQAPRLAALVQQFKDNIAVGSCGSGMEQHFEAAKLALKKAARQDGLEQPVPQSEFLHDNSKLVVVFVGDEDDCSNPDDGTGSLAFDRANFHSSDPGADVCVTEEGKDLDQQKLFRVSDYADFLVSLGRPFGAAFVYSASLGTDGRCQPDGHGGCTPGTCDCQCPTHCTICDSNQSGDCWKPGPNDDQCKGNIGLAESRFHQLSGALRGRTLADGSSVSTFEASVCEADWAQTLEGIARLVAPPSGLTLPTLPADRDVVALSIQDANGNARSYCDGPQVPVEGETFQPTLDWWFVTCDEHATPSAIATKCIKVNPSPSAKCQPNPGETYIAFYLGRVPESGCFSDQECNDAFHSLTGSFECRGFSGARDQSGTPGTCVCR
jgi:hypothetical protein